MFIHQFSHLWIDFRGIQDTFMREGGWTTSRTAGGRHWSTKNTPCKIRWASKGYGPYCWGLTASDGPGPTTLQVKGIERRLDGYLRGRTVRPGRRHHRPLGGGCLPPLAPEVVLATIRHFHELYPEVRRDSQFKCSFNPTFSDAHGPRCGWVSPDHYGLNEGPIILMTENYRCDFLWKLMRHCP